MIVESLKFSIVSILHSWDQSFSLMAKELIVDQKYKVGSGVCLNYNLSLLGRGVKLYKYMVGDFLEGHGIPGQTVAVSSGGFIWFLDLNDEETVAKDYPKDRSVEWYE